MSGLFYAIFVLAILVIIRWYVQNDTGNDDIDGSKGFLAMRAAQRPIAKKKFRAGADTQSNSPSPADATPPRRKD